MWKDKSLSITIIFRTPFSLKNLAISSFISLDKSWIKLETLFSFFLTSPYIEFYLIYYKLPISSAISNYYYFYIGGIFAIFGGVLGSYLGAKGVLKLKPADAMRPIAPKPVKKAVKKAKSDDTVEK